MKMMKRMMAFLLLLFLLSVPGFRAAAGEQPVALMDPVLDLADIWPDAAENEFRDAALEIDGIGNTDVVLLSVRLLYFDLLGERTYGSITEFADDFYWNCGFGGNDGQRSGIILVISNEPGNRQFCVRTFGREQEAYSLEDLTYLEDSIQPLLIGGDFEGAARKYLELAAVHEAKGTFAEESTKNAESSQLLWTFGLAALVAWAITSSMKRRMRPVQKATAARNYTVRGSYQLRHYDEIYLGTTVTKMPRGQNRQGGAGGPSAGGRRF